MARVTHPTGFGWAGRMWHRHDTIPDELVTPSMLTLGWVELDETPAPRVETATAAPGERRSTPRPATAKKTTAKRAKKSTAKKRS